MLILTNRARDYQVLNQSGPILTSRNRLGSANLLFYQSEKNRNFGFEFSRIGPKHARNHNTRTFNFLSGGYQSINRSHTRHKRFPVYSIACVIRERDNLLRVNNTTRRVHISRVSSNCLWNSYKLTTLLHSSLDIFYNPISLDSYCCRTGSHIYRKRLN